MSTLNMALLTIILTVAYIYIHIHLFIYLYISTYLSTCPNRCRAVYVCMQKEASRRARLLGVLGNPYMYRSFVYQNTHRVGFGVDSWPPNLEQTLYRQATRLPNNPELVGGAPQTPVRASFCCKLFWIWCLASLRKGAA